MGRFTCSDFGHGEYSFLALHTPHFSIQLTRLSVFILLLAIAWRQRHKFSWSDSDIYPNASSSFLLLPVYFDLLRLFICYIVAVTVVNLFFPGVAIRPSGLSFQIGFFHFFYDGLWFLFTQYGAGYKAFARSGVFGMASTIVSIIIFYATATNIKGHDNDYWFRLMAGYNAVYTILFALPIVVPKMYLYRRPPMLLYTTVMSLYHLLFLIFCIILYYENDDGHCLALAIYIAFDCVVKPCIVVVSLAVDSSYWQGTGVDNPSAGLWEVDANIATTIATADSKQSKVPFLHFGLLSLNKDVGFVAGGFSRVYFGKYRKEKVALKMLFVIELTPESISDFCREAEVLHQLKHPNILVCRGVCIMPPAIGIVLEFCALGSLFDFLYKARASKGSMFNPGNVRSTLFRKRITNNSSSRSRIDNESSSVDQYELRSSRGAMLSTNRSRFSDLSRKSSTDKENELQSGITVEKLAFRSLFNESRNNLIPTWESLTIRCTAADGMFPFNVVEEESGAASINPLNSLETQDVENPRAPIRNTTFIRRSSGGGLKESSIGFQDGLVDSTPAGINDGSIGGLSTLFQKSTSQNNQLKPILEAHSRSDNGAELIRTDLPLYLLEGLSMAHNLSVFGTIEALCDITRGLAYLHHRGYMHCDIKSLNFLVSENYRVKLADFGEARPINTIIAGSSRPPIPAMNWCPPEVLHPGATSSSYTAASDVFGLAMVLSEVLRMQLPLDEYISKHQSYSLWRKMLVDGVRPQLPDYIPTQLRDIISAAWSTEPSSRPTAEDILQVLEIILLIDEVAWGKLAVS